MFCLGSAAPLIGSLRRSKQRRRSQRRPTDRLNDSSRSGLWTGSDARRGVANYSRQGPPPYPYDTVDGPAAPHQVHEYARIATEMPACGVRPKEWGDAIFAILKASIPIGRDDLQRELRFGIQDANTALAFELADRRCGPAASPARPSAAMRHKSDQASDKFSVLRSAHQRDHWARMAATSGTSMFATSAAAAARSRSTKRHLVDCPTTRS
jgi:hypothetical protein